MIMRMPWPEVNAPAASLRTARWPGVGTRVRGAAVDRSQRRDPPGGRGL